MTTFRCEIMQHSKSGFAGRHRSFRWLHRSVLRLALFSFVSICLKISPGGHSMAFANDSAPEISSELKNLQTKASKHPSFKVKFEQTVFSALRKKSTKSEGELIFAQPRKFRWEILSPFRELYVNNGEWFWKYVETTKHALRLPATAGELDFLDVIFQLDKLQNKYRLQRIKLLSDVNGMPADGCPQSHTCIALQPLQKGPQSNIELAISQLNGFVSTVRIDFRNGNRTLISFSSFKGENVNSKVFEFTPPAGTAVDKR